MKLYKDKKHLVSELVSPEDIVLDVGFWGQGTTVNDPAWPHALLLARAKKVYGVDLDFDERKLSTVNDIENYVQGDAESFSFNKKFDVIFAGDLIEHLSNPGLFLDVARHHLAPGGRLVLTTPNCFNLFNIAMKITRSEPVVNPDHTCYFNSKTLTVLLEKNDWSVSYSGFLYTLGATHQESLKKKFLNLVYAFFALFTNKFVETLVIVAQPNNYDQ